MHACFLCAEIIHYDRVPIKANKTFNNDFLMIVVKQKYNSRKQDISQSIYVLLIRNLGV